MNSLELTKPITTESLLNEFESRFKQTMDLSKFNEEELQDYANHVRTKIHEITQNTHFGQELKDNTYQKSQMMLDIINQAIQERKLGEYGGMNTDPQTGKMVQKIQKASGLNDKEKKEIIGGVVTKETEVKEGVETVAETAADSAMEIDLTAVVKALVSSDVDLSEEF